MANFNIANVQNGIAPAKQASYPKPRHGEYNLNKHDIHKISAQRLA